MSYPYPWHPHFQSITSSLLSNSHAFPVCDKISKRNGQSFVTCKTSNIHVISGSFQRCTQVNFFLAKSSYKSQVQWASQFTSFQQIIGPSPSQVKLNTKWAKSSHKYLTWFKSILKYMFYGKMLFCVGLHSKPSLGLECRPTPNW